jgi:acyl-CoA thioesterase I
MCKTICLVTVAAAALAAALSAGPAAAADPPPKLPAKCEISADLLPDAVPLPHAVRSVRRNHQLTVVALGSSSTLGLGASDAQAAWPARLEAALAAQLPGTEVHVTNRGVARESAEQMLQRLDTDVLADKPSVVIWESGTAEAVRGADVEDYTDALLAGVDKMSAAGIDVILMDTQYSRGTAQVINFQPYIAAIDQVAGMRGLARFPRYGVMHYWVDNDRFTFAGKTAIEARKTADQVYDCLGQLLAVWVLRGVSAK